MLVSTPTPEEIIRDYGPKVYNLARRILGSESDAEDVTQDVLLTVIQKLPTFRGEASFSTWLHRITVNAALAYRQKRARRTSHQITMDPIEELIESGQHKLPIRKWAQTPEKLLVDRETQEVIERAIASLPEVYRDVYILADIEGLPNAEIAEMLGLNLPGTKSRLHRARLLMRKALAPYFEEKTS